MVELEFMRFDNGTHLVENVSELPILTDFSDLFADFETTSGHRRKKSTNPWHFCDILGIGLTVDDCPHAWYVPVGHHDEKWNLPKDTVKQWWRDTMHRAKRWINHNVKYDCHVSINHLDAPVPDELELVDTLTAAKLIDSDRMFKGGYGLSTLSAAWLMEDISKYEEAFAAYVGKHNKDYGAVPADLMGEYGGQDVLSVRKLFKAIQQRMPEALQDVWETERALTTVLLDIEQIGLQTCDNLEIHDLKALHKMVQLEDELEELVGRSFRPDTNAGCREILCEQYGLPVLGWTEKGEPSFDKHALRAYSLHPLSPKPVVKRIMAYRKLATLRNFFITPYQELRDEDGILHSDYNQCVRTGRLACKQPNAMQLSKAAKELVVPGEGMSFLSADLSQIEFRTTIHYIKDDDAIAAWNEDPDTDFHQLVADWCEIDRRPAKTVNLGMSFGMGKGKLLTQLSAEDSLVGPLKIEAERMVKEISKLEPGTNLFDSQLRSTFAALAKTRATEVYDQYHSTFPNLKRTSTRAGDAARRKGYVHNLYGRRRHLPPQVAHIAFNALNQSTAADIMKERMVAIWRMIRGTPLQMQATVHDELLIRGPTELIEDPRTISDYVSAFESPGILEKLRVPIRATYGVSSKHWREASSIEERIPAFSPCNQMEHLKCMSTRNFSSTS